MRKLALALLLAAILVPMGSTESEAKLDPLKYITDQLIRPDVMIVFDTSGSMNYTIGGGNSGSDCSGNNAAFDVCGDFMCSGHETTATCAADCQMYDQVSGGSVQGNAQKCIDTTVATSRMFMAKRALRIVLPELRTVASFGLTTFEQSGYHRYYPANGPTTAGQYKAIYLHEWELRPTGSWTKGQGWDTTNDRPKPSFKVDTGSTVSYTLLASGAGDSLYRRHTASGYVYARFAWDTAKRSYNDGTYEWEYQGSYYTTPTYPIATAGSFLVSGYRGPFYEDPVGSGTIYVHNRLGPGVDIWSPVDLYGILPVNSGLVRVPFATITTQADADNQVGTLLNWLSDTDNGGMHAGGGTPTGLAIEEADKHYQARALSDSNAACRPRFVLVLSDGESSSGLTPNPVTAAADLLARFPSNPIKTYALGLPGISGDGADELDAIAAAGGTLTALTANNEKELVDNIRTVLYGALSGEYTTAASSVTTSSGATIVGDTAIVPSTSFPSWKGHLRSFDLTKLATDPAYERWDAGSLLSDVSLPNWYERKVYTAPATGQDVVPMWDASGAVDLAAIKAVWPGTPPSDAQITAMVQWLGGSGRSWRLGSIINATPATVGPPPTYATVKYHDLIEADQLQRQKLVYVPSNDGLLHAFCAETGKEMFAFVPPSLFPKIYTLYSQGGQDPDPTKFDYVMTNSPRVDDMADKGGKNWRTVLVQTFGGGGEDFVVLDITDPTTCSDPEKVSTCSTKSTPLKVIFRSKGTSVEAYYGDTWSIPALFWAPSARGRAAGGSGPAANPAEGEYYAFWNDAEPVAGWDTSSFKADQHTVSSPQVDFSVVANGVAVRLPTGDCECLATYQASLNGKIERYEEGKADKRASAPMIDGGTANPFFFSPAAYYRNDGSDRVTIAAASGAFQANDSFITTGSFKTTLYMRSETDGSVLTDDDFTCDVDQLCSSSCYHTAPVCPDGIPSAKARPVASPLLLDNKATGMIEAFYLLYDPPSAVCNGNKVAIGDSWLIRVATGTSGQELKEAKKYAETQVSGLTLVAGGKDIGLSVTGRGTGETSTVETKSGNVVGSGGSGGGTLHRELARGALRWKLLEFWPARPCRVIIEPSV